MKKIIIIASVILICIIIILSLILGKKSTTNTQKNSPFPTSIPSSQSLNLSISQSPNLSNSSNSQINISTITPVETEDFKLQYSAQLKKLVVEKKTPQADEKFKKWAYQNNLHQLVGNDNLVLKVALGKGPEEFNPLLEFLSIFLNFGQSQSNQSTPANSPTSYPNLTPFPTYSGNTSGKVYYAQCGGSYGNIPFAPGCTLCFAGCGPTTVAMFAASYLNSSYNPQTIIDLYKSNGYYLGCDGTKYTDAYQLFQKLGFQTTTIYEYNFVTADKVVPDLRNYLASGWTFFTLVKGHFFWITDIDSQGNIFAYDPVYSSSVPYNENSHDPVRLYFRIFGVKK